MMKSLFALLCTFGWCVFASAQATIPISGGDFEAASAEHWNILQDGQTEITLDTKVPLSGDSSLRVHDRDGQGWTLLSRSPIRVEPGEHLVFSALARVEADKVDYTVELGLIGSKNGRPTGPIHRTTGGYGLNDGIEPFRMQVFTTVPNDCDGIFLRAIGRKLPSTVWLDDFKLEKLVPPKNGPNPKVEGYATDRIKEPLDRGLIAVPYEKNGVYLSWRLLDSDPANTGFNIYRMDSTGRVLRLNREPITQTTDFVDSTVDKKAGCTWFVVSVLDGQKEGKVLRSRAVASSETPYISIPLDGIRSFQFVALADLDGDGRLDYVVKTPKKNIDPNHLRWEKSTDTFKLYAFNADGKKLWQYDMGWGIELGIWFSPILAADLDGDGKAEVALKWAADHRDATGRVRTGDEYLLILNGMTGKEVTRTEWPKREATCFSHLNRNQLCLAYLDGKTPFIVAIRGTYNVMQVEAFEFSNNTLKKHWHWNNKCEPRNCWGQGAHTTHVVDLDGDGRDEIVLGSLVLDDDGTVLWTTGMGHPDHLYVADLDPMNPGLEIYYGMETSLDKNGICMVDAATGKLIWGIDYPTIHIHSKGMCADIDAKSHGCEMYSGEEMERAQSWLRNAKGEILCTNCLPSLHPRVVWWDASKQKSVLSGSRDCNILSYPSMKEVTPITIEGSIIQIVDLFGDWREEIITMLPNEMRIYTTTIPAKNRRVTLLQDNNYRSTVYESAMGLPQDPVPTQGSLE